MVFGILRVASNSFDESDLNSGNVGINSIEFINYSRIFGKIKKFQKFYIVEISIYRLKITKDNSHNYN